jgi:crossover junction endodeoxyribonuclease RusA
MKVVLPWPDKPLWPNGSEGNRFAKSAAKKKARNAASWAAIEARRKYGLPAHGGKAIAIRLYVYAKPKGPLPDRDNCIAAVKVQLDAIAEQIDANDRQFLAPVVSFCAPRDGHMEVEIG